MGCFVAPPLESFFEITGEMKLQLRREYLYIRSISKIWSDSRNPAFNLIINTSKNQLFSNCNITKPLQSSPERLHLQLNPNCLLPNVQLNFDLNCYPKQITPTEVFIQSFNVLRREKYNNCYEIYTDGSKSMESVDSASFSTLLLKLHLFQDKLLYILRKHTISNWLYQQFETFSSIRS